MTRYTHPFHFPQSFRSNGETNFVLFIVDIAASLDDKGITVRGMFERFLIIGETSHNCFGILTTAFAVWKLSAKVIIISIQ